MGEHLLGCKDLQNEEIEWIISRANSHKVNEAKGHKPVYKQKFVSNLFLEPSTRTRFSFEVAEKKLGLQVLNFQADSSSLQKGESIYDTLKTLEAIGVEAAVIRSKEEILSEVAPKIALKLINAGEGKKEHPTQALLDLMTIKSYFNEIKGLNVAIIGDIAHSRVARSNAYLLNRLGANVIFSGPETLQAYDLNGKYLTVDEAIRSADVVMMLRIQFERMEKSIIQSTTEYNQKFGFTESRLELLQPHAIILHPAPVNRGVEMDDSVIEHRQSKIFEQIANGVFIRMAVLERALEE